MATTHTASWVNVRRYFPDVTKPLFHATTGPRAAQIALSGQGIRSNSGASSFEKGNADGGVSMSRNLDFLLKGGFGNVIFVFDERELRSRYRMTPVAYGHSSGWEDEYEERVYAQAIPAKLIRGVIFRNKLRRFEAEEWTDAVHYPIIHRDGGSWMEASVTNVVSRHLAGKTAGSQYQRLTSAKVSADLKRHKELGAAGKYQPQLRNIVFGFNCKQVTPVLVSVSLETRSRGATSEHIQEKWKKVLDCLVDSLKTCSTATHTFDRIQ